jgi:hypothetical protein
MGCNALNEHSKKIPGRATHRMFSDGIRNPHHPAVPAGSMKPAEPFEWIAPFDLLDVGAGCEGQGTGRA